MKVELKNVERELAALWDEEAARAHSSRVELLTLVALVSEPSLLERAKAVLAQVACVHACRTITALWRSGETPEIFADVYLHKNQQRKNNACGDGIVLEAVGGAREWLPGNIERLLLTDLPAYVWWVGDLPDSDDLFDRMARRADVVLVNSAEMDLRDLQKLSEIVTASHDSYALMDLTWVRMRGFQDLVARFFDDPQTRPYLDTLREVTICTAPRENETDATSTRAGLLLGWMGSALSLVADSAQWTKTANGADLVVNREGGRVVTFHFERDGRADVHDGTVTRIELVCDAPDGALARFEVGRQADPLVLRWQCDAPGCVVPVQVVRFGSHEESELLMRSLERPARDRLLEQSLATASRILSAVAPRFSERPPRT